MSTNKEDTLKQFCDVTGADETRSRFFLESSNWQLEVALSSFYEHGGNVEEAPSNQPALPSIPVLSDSDMESPPASPAKKKNDKKKPVNTKFATVHTLQQDSSSDDEEALKQECCFEPSCSKQYKKVTREYSSTVNRGKDNEIVQLNVKIEELLKENYDLKKEINDIKIEIIKIQKENIYLKNENTRLERGAQEGQAFYAGGSERSGQQIIGPGKGRKDVVSEMFKSVRERGAVVFEDEQTSAARGGRGGGAFSGTGYRLGQTSDDHEQVTPTGNQQSDQARTVRLRLYREGYTVDTGALRSYGDPEHAEFLNCIRRGEIPPELSDGGGEVRVSLEDRRMDSCPQQSCKPQAFTGKGHMLGSPTPATVGATVPIASNASDRAANTREAQLMLHLDETLPTTTVQFRLTDGTRVSGRFNHTHTVADLHQFVVRAEPYYQLRDFTLVTTFPSAELSDPTVTLAGGKLLNTTVLQRLK